jgi:hypothetical protein
VSGFVSGREELALCGGSALMASWMSGLIRWFLLRVLARRVPGRGLSRPEAGRWCRAAAERSGAALIQYG